MDKEDLSQEEESENWTLIKMIKGNQERIESIKEEMVELQEEH